MSVFFRGQGKPDEQCCGCKGRTGPCDEAPEPTLVCRTAEASISKDTCYFPEYASPSSPPKYYQEVAYSGSFDTTCQAGARRLETFSGVLALPGAPACAPEVSLGSWNEKIYSTTSTDCDTLDSDTTDDIASHVVNGQAPDYSLSWFSVSYSLTSTVSTLTPTCSGCTGSVTQTLQNEYTTAELWSDTEAAIPAFSGSFANGYCTSALRDLSTDEITATLRAMEYKFTLPTLTDYSCYRISWRETFYPAGGGASSYTSKVYYWDGSATETGTYTIDPPASAGYTEISDVVVTCDCEP